MASGDNLFFIADNGGGDRDHWKSNGTAAGTTRLRNFASVPEFEGSEGFFMAPMGSFMYLVADDGPTGLELWKSNGTTTSIVRDIAEGAGTSFPNQLCAVGNTLYFDLYGIQLEKTDGTLAGTLKVKSVVGAEQLTAAGTKLYFVSGEVNEESTIVNQEVWCSDGSSGGTFRLKDIAPGLDTSFPEDLTAVGSTLYFSVRAPLIQLWKTNGTPAGTVPVKDIPVESYYDFGNFAAAGDLLYYTKGDGGSRSELWRSDGTEAGTFELVNFSDEGPDFFSSIGDLTAVGSTLFFTASDGAHGNELWKSDGTALGTRMVRDIEPGVDGSIPSHLVAAGNALYFIIVETLADSSLWRSDGTVAGTRKVAYLTGATYLDDFGLEGGPSFQLVPAGGFLYYQASSAAGGKELYAWQYAEPPPEVTTDPADNLTISAATLKGVVNPKETFTSAWFEWGSTTDYGQTTALQDVAPGSVGVLVSANLIGLPAGTTYHFRLVARNGSNVVFGNDRTFTTTSAPLSNDANLSALAANPGTLAPSFSAANVSYTMTVANEVTSIAVTPVSSHSGALIRIDGVTVASGTGYTAAIPNFGANLISIQVTAENGTTSKTYSLTVTRQLGSNANLTQLALSPGILSPEFTSATLGYTAIVPYPTTSVTTTLSLADSAASASVNGSPAVSGPPGKAVDLVVGANPINVQVTAQNGVTTRTYTIIVTRQTAFQTWIAGFSGAGGKGSGDDLDGDGLVNILEYAFGLNPSSGSSMALPSGQKVGSNFVISFTEPPGISGITYGAQWSDSPAGPLWTAVPDSGIGGTHVFSVPTAGKVKMFMRLIVTGN